MLPSHENPTSWPMKIRCGVFGLALFLPLFLIAIARPYRIPSTENHFQFGWEAGRVAASIASGGGFSSPYPLPSGPTAMQPPVYPLILAVIFKLFGLYSATSAFVALALDCVLFAFTTVLVIRLGTLVADESVGIFSGLAWAVNPYALYVSSTKIWETALSTFLIITILIAIFQLSSKSRLAIWFVIGFACGVTVLTNSSILLALPFLWGWKAMQLRRVSPHLIRKLAAMAIGFVVILVPWGIRNFRVFNKPILLRSNLWEEVRFGNCLNIDLPKSKAEMFDTWDSGSPQTAVNNKSYPLSGYPSVSRSELQLYRRLGEMEYMKEMKLDAIWCVRSNPMSFLRLTLRRIAFTWTGAFYIWPETNGLLARLQPEAIVSYSAVSTLAFIGLFLLLKRNFQQALPFAILLLTYPLVYYATHITFRYRYPIDPEITVLASLTVISAIRAVRRMRSPNALV